MKVSDLLTVFRQITSRREWPLVTFIVIGSLALIWLLKFNISPRPVRVPGTSIAFRLDCIPASVQIRVLGATAGTPIASAQYFDTNGKPRTPRIDYDVKLNAGSTYTDLNLTTRPEIRSHLLKKVNDAWATIELHFGRTIHVDLLHMSGDPTAEASFCPTGLLTEGQLLGSLRVPGSKILYYRFMQEVVSDVALAINDAVGNYVLAMMILAALWVTYHLIIGFRLIYLATDETLRRRISDRKTRARAAGINEPIKEIITADYLNLERRLAFARTVGPGIGFLLTVSSIIAALHPAVQIQQDAFRFITSLQLAMTATLVGLLIRIAAEFAIRLQRSALQRAREFARS